MTTDRTRIIAELNDCLRCEPENSDHLGWHVSTPGIDALDIVEQCYIGQLVSHFDDFTPDNDPHGGRDFGAFEHEGKRIFWKIDYYNRDLTGGSEDPADPAKTVRVLTIMLAAEY